MVNPSPYMVYLQARGSILVASSPEILCRLGEDRTVTNRYSSCPALQPTVRWSGGGLGYPLMYFLFCINPSEHPFLRLNILIQGGILITMSDAASRAGCCSHGTDSGRAPGALPRLVLSQVTSCTISKYVATTACMPSTQTCMSLDNNTTRACLFCVQTHLPPMHFNLMTGFR